MILNRNLPNSSSFSYMTADEILSKGNVIVDKAKDTLDKFGPAKGGPKDKESSPPAPKPMPPAKSETLIFGMHPVTLTIGAVGVLFLTGVIFVAVKHFNK